MPGRHLSPRSPRIDCEPWFAHAHTSKKRIDSTAGNFGLSSNGFAIEIVLEFVMWSTKTASLSTGSDRISSCFVGNNKEIIVSLSKYHGGGDWNDDFAPIGPVRSVISPCCRHDKLISSGISNESR